MVDTFISKIKRSRFRSCLLAAAPLLFLFGCGADGSSRELKQKNGTASVVSNAQKPTTDRRSSVTGTVRQDPRQVRSENVRRVRVADVIETIVGSLESGRGETARVLREARLTSVVDDILSLDGFQIHDISSEALLREVYRRAEAASRGQGKAVLAYLYKKAEKEYGSLRTEPKLSEIRRIATTLPPESLDPANFRFASAQSARNVSFPPVLERAIQQLAYVYSRGNLSQLRGLALTTFRKPGFDFDRIVSESSNSRDALRRIFRQGAPPPPPEKAARTMMGSVLKYSGSLGRDAEFVASFNELSSELGLERLDGGLRTYTENEDRIPTRRAQMAEASARSLPGKIDKPNSESLTEAMLRSKEVPYWVEPELNNSAQQYSDYVGTSFTDRPEEPRATTAGGSGGGGGAGGGGGESRRTTYKTNPPTRSYRARLPDLPKVSRSYTTAIRSGRAGRGVSVGAPFGSKTDSNLIRAAWAENRKDGRFGRLIVEMERRNGEKLLAVSRTFFADSFYSVTSLLWGGHRGTTAFREGEILVLMSMDPFAIVDPESIRELEAKAQELQERAQQIGDDDYVEGFNLMTELLSLEESRAKLPRRVVVHPALFGRELAWSAVRVDFWFNDIAGLSDEARLTNGGKPMPKELQRISISGAGTWQFFEREATIRLSGGSSRIQQLTVISSGPKGLKRSDRSHFALSMFRLDETDPQSEPSRLRSLEVELQPMLDWLSTNHHDFIRLNDFSESFILLRWIKQNGISPILVDMDGEAPEIATPDRITLNGPGVGGR